MGKDGDKAYNTNGDDIIIEMKKKAPQDYL